MLGFDRGGSYAQVFAHCRAHGVDWITYRRGKLADTTAARAGTGGSTPPAAPKR